MLKAGGLSRRPSAKPITDQILDVGLKTFCPDYGVGTAYTVPVHVYHAG